MLKIGIIGCGTIGSEICKAIDNGTVSGELIGVCDIDAAVSKKLTESLQNKMSVISQTELIQASDLIVEATNRKEAPKIVRETLQSSKDILVLSVGGLLTQIDEFKALAQANKCFIYVPSGAIAGIDAVKGAMIAEISKATLTTRKPPRGLEGAPYIVENHINLKDITEPMVVFSGSATEAVPAFPANINVAAALSLAGIGPDKTQVKIIADPTLHRNTHEIMVEGDFGKLLTRTELLTAPHNPKTSLLAALSAISLLQRITSSVIIGT